MKTRLLMLGAILTAAAGLAWADEKKAGDKAADMIKKLADEAGKKDWEAMSKTGSGMAKEHELLDIMNLYKKRMPGAKIQGLGFGTKPGQYKEDGIEAKLQSLTKRPMTKDELTKQSADLIRLAEITAAIASVSTHQCIVDKKEGKKDPAKWKAYSEDGFKAAQDFIKAVKANNPNELKAAANKLYASCTECHSDFRE